MDKLLNQIINNPGFHTLSLDIFDTILMRRLAPERFRFKQIAKQFSQQIKSKGFFVSWFEIYKSRILSAHIEYKTAPIIQGEREGRFEKILELQLKALKLPMYLMRDLAEIEIQYEKRVLYPNKDIIDLCSSIRNMEKRIIFVSDMYLSKLNIIDLLKAHNLENLYDDLYVSSELGITKNGGALFRYIVDKENLDSSGYFHVGDNYHSDFISPKNNNWSAIWLPRSRLWRLTNNLWNKYYF